MSSKNIMTGIVVALALVLVVVVVLVKSDVFEKKETTTTEIETVIESEIIVVSETDMWGDVTFLTMVTKYVRPKYSSIHKYPTTTTTTEAPEDETSDEETTTTTTEIQYVELSTVVHATDENGNRLFEEDGTPITETVYYTVDANSLTTTETTEYIPETSVIEVTNELGETVTEIVTLPPPSTSATTTVTQSSNTRWDTTTSTKKDGINVDLKTPGRDDILAEKIVEQINEDRVENGLEPLVHDESLRASARKKSLALALPSVYNQDEIEADYTATTKFGGESLYMKVVDGTKDKALSGDVSKIGLGIVVQDGVYYTSVIYG